MTRPRSGEALVHGSSGLQLVVEPKTDRFDTADERWREQVTSLYRDLRQEAGAIRIESRPSAGEKGAATDIILALGSSGALTAAVTMFKAWLARDRTRSLELSWNEGDRQRRFVIRATDLDESTFDELARQAAEQFDAG